VVEEQRCAGVHRSDAGHLVVGECEVEDVDVLGDAVGPDRFRDDDDAALDEPAQDDLGDGLAECALEEGVGLDLVDRGGHLVVVDEVNQVSMDR
jgi:hypothetical protein